MPPATLSRAALLPRRPDAALRHATLSALAARPPADAQQQWAAALAQAPAEWLAFAERHEAAPHVAHALRAANVGDVAARAPFEAHHTASTARMAVLLTTLDRVAARLARAGIPLVALKNAGIARGLHPCPACSPMGDLDLLVTKADYLAAHALLLAEGFALASRSTVAPPDVRHGLREGGTEYRADVAGETVWLELQWRPIAGRWIRPDQEPAAAELLARSVAIPGTAARLLAPADNLLQVALHTAKHSFVRAPGLRLHTDVDRIVAAAPPDWDALVAAARRLTVQTPVFFSLALGAVLLGTPVPAATLAALRPPRWKEALVTAWLRRVDVFEPAERKFSRPGLLAFHALLYDDALGLLGALTDSDRAALRPRELPRLVGRTARRLTDLLWRYQR